MCTVAYYFTRQCCGVEAVSVAAVFLCLALARRLFALSLRLWLERRCQRALRGTGDSSFRKDSFLN